MMMGKACAFHKVAGALLFVGGLNWGLVGAFNYNLVEAVLGGWPWLVRVVYVLVGVSALSFLCYKRCCGACEKCNPKK